MKYTYNIKNPVKGPSKVSWLVLCASAAFSLPVLSDDEPFIEQDPAAVVQNSDTTVYIADFFTQYNPHNARDMVLLIPGFILDEGSSARGFGGNAGNVLIDGSRPTSKSGGLQGALIRMSAQQVKRIEILRGGVSAGEAAGQSIVANIISHKALTVSAWTMRARQTASTRVKANVEATLSTTIGQWATAFDTDLGVVPGNRNATVQNRDENAELITGLSESYPTATDTVIFNGEGSRDIGGAKLTLNGRLEGVDWQAQTNRNVFAGRLPDGSEPDLQIQINERDKKRLTELGGDWTDTNDQWKLRLLGLGVIDDRRYSFQRHQQDINGAFSDISYNQDRLKTEFVGRATYAKVGDAIIKPEFGFEVANNRLDTDATSANGGTPSPVFGSDVVVEEWRGESFANVVYAFDSDWSFEGGLTAEFSQIKVTGDANQQQTFRFIKPRLSATYRVNDDIRWTFETQRVVGQLDFNDFAASSVADEDRTNAGNPDLSPELQTEATTTFDWGFSERGSLKVKIKREWRSDKLEQIILSTDEQGNVNQGVGNAGKARTWELTTQLNLPVDSILEHGLFDIFYRLRDSDFDDEIIGRQRNISIYTPEWWQLSFRQDLSAQQLTWGFTYSGGFHYGNYLVDEHQNLKAEKTLLLFAETTAFFDVKIRLEINDFNTTRTTRVRHFYNQTRGETFIGNEMAKRQSKPYFLLSVFGDF
ncbi:MAG: hypothetical protein ACI9FJ_001880 [Alteromonadaceae bacterium]|jgi:hypothetical protein